MVREYWNYNKKSLILMEGLFLLLMGFSFFLMYYSGFEPFFNGMEMANEAEIFANINTIFLFAAFGFFMGALSLFYGIVQIYFFLKPFINKQLQQTTLMGNDPRKYVHIHLIVVLGLTLIATAVAYFIPEEINGIYQSVNTQNIFKILLSSIAWPLWIMAIPLTIMNGKVLNNISSKKRTFFIIGGYVLLWFMACMIYVIPNMHEFFSMVSTNAITVAANDSGMTVNNIMNSTKMLILDLLVDFIGIFVFILAYNSFSKSYEMT